MLEPSYPRERARRALVALPGGSALRSEARPRPKVLYFDLDGTVIHSGFGETKRLLANGGLERAARGAGFDRLVCVGNAVAIITALQELGRSPDGAEMIFRLCAGAFVDYSWFHRVTSWAPDPRHRAKHICFDDDWWYVDDLARKYFSLEGMEDRLEQDLGRRVLIPDPEGEGDDILVWLGAMKV